MLKEAPRKYNIIQTKDVKLTLIVDIVDKGPSSQGQPKITSFSSLA